MMSSLPKRKAVWKRSSNTTSIEGWFYQLSFFVTGHQRHTFIEKSKELIHLSMLMHLLMFCGCSSNQKNYCFNKNSCGQFIMYFLEDKTSEIQTEVSLSKIELLKQKLVQWCEVIDERHPSIPHWVTSQNVINVNKLVCCD